MQGGKKLEIIEDAIKRKILLYLLNSNCFRKAHKYLL